MEKYRSNPVSLASKECWQMREHTCTYGCLLRQVSWGYFLPLHKQIIVQARGVASATTFTAPPKSWPQETSENCSASVISVRPLNSFWHCKPGLLSNLCRWCSISCRLPQICCPSRPSCQKSHSPNRSLWGSSQSCLQADPYCKSYDTLWWVNEKRTMTIQIVSDDIRFTDSTLSTVAKIAK